VFRGRCSFTPHASSMLVLIGGLLPLYSSLARVMKETTHDHELSLSVQEPRFSTFHFCAFKMLSSTCVPNYEHNQNTMSGGSSITPSSMFTSWRKEKRESDCD
jgi:hypothetical protein